MVGLVLTAVTGCGAAVASPGPQLSSPPAATPAPPADPAPIAAAATPAPTPVPVGRPALLDLHSLDELKARFEADRGKPRLILLVSPT